MKRGAPLRRTPLRSRSPKRARAERELAGSIEALRRVTADWCEGATPACPPWRHRGHHAHHVLSRARGGGHAVTNLRWLCASAHTWVHLFPEAATAAGLLASGRA